MTMIFVSEVCRIRSPNRFPLRFASPAQIALSTFLVKFNSTYSKSHDPHSAPELRVVVS